MYYITCSRWENDNYVTISSQPPIFLWFKYSRYVLKIICKILATIGDKITPIIPNKNSFINNAKNKNKGCTFIVLLQIHAWITLLSIWEFINRKMINKTVLSLTSKKWIVTNRRLPANGPIYGNRLNTANKIDNKNA